MTPTQAQIEAARAAYKQATLGDPVGGSDYAWREALTAAAQVGGPYFSTLQTHLRQEVDATVERCAQVAEKLLEKYLNHVPRDPATIVAIQVLREAIDAIRKLKDEP